MGDGREGGWGRCYATQPLPFDLLPYLTTSGQEAPPDIRCLLPCPIRRKVSHGVSHGDGWVGGCLLRKSTSPFLTYCMLVPAHIWWFDASSNTHWPNL